MKVGPCRLCGKAVDVDDAEIQREWTAAVSGAPQSQQEYAQRFIIRIAEMVGPAICHSVCVEDYQTRYRSNQAKQERTRRAAKFSQICPFRGGNATQIENLPFAAKYEVMEVFAAGRSVTLQGETGRGKSRLAWLLVEAPFMAGTPMEIWTHVGLKNALQQASAQGPGASATIVNRISMSPILFLDDLGKAEMVNKDGTGLQIEEQMFQILDSRLTSGRRTILTTNDTGETLGRRMSPDRGAPLVRRIRELTACFNG